MYQVIPMTIAEALKAADTYKSTINGDMVQVLSSALREAIGLLREGHGLDYRARWRFLDKLTGTETTCEHRYVDARNKYVESGEVCLQCGAIRAGNTANRSGVTK